MKNLHLLYTLLLVSYALTSQAQKQHLGYPIVDIYEASEFYGDSQNWDIIQDNNGMLLVGNNTNIKEFDGVEWRNISVKQRRLRNFSKTESGRIFLSAYGEFGYLAYDEYGSRQFVSLLDKLKKEDQPKEEVWHCEATDKEAYFSTYEKVYYYDHNKVEPLTFEPAWPHVNKVGSNIFLFETEARFSLLKNGKKYTLPHLAKAINNERVQNVLPYKNDKILIYTYSNTFIVYDLKKLLETPITNWSETTIQPSILKNISNQLDDFLRNLHRRYAVSLNGDGYAFAGNSLLIITDNDLKIRKSIDKNLGTDREIIYKMLCDNVGNLWCTHSKGISMIKLNSPVALYDKRSEYDEYTMNFTKFKGEYIASAWDKMVTLKPNKYAKYNYAIETLQNEQAWSYCPMDDRLLYGTTVGIYDFYNQKRNLIFESKQSTIYAIQQLDKKPDWLVIGEQGLSLLKFKKTSSRRPITISDTLKINEIKDDVRIIVQDDNGDIWFRTNPFELFVLRINENTTKGYELHQINDGSKEILNEIAFYDSKLLVSKSGKLFSLKYDKTKLGNFELVNHQLTDSLSSSYVTFLKTHKNELFVGTDEGIVIVTQDKQSNFQLNRDQFIGVNQLKEFFCFDGDLWGISSDAIFNLDREFKPKKNTLFNAIVRQVTINGDSLIQYGTYVDDTKFKDSLYYFNSFIQPESMIPELKYEDNTISFEFGTNNYDKENALSFSYQLQGYDDDWSSYSDETKKEYTNLPEGEYSFDLLCSDSRGAISKKASYRFVIQPPWYRTWYAYLIYFISATSIIYLIIFISLRSLRKNNKKLEQAVKEATDRIEGQNSKLKEAQSQLTEVMSAVKEELGQTSVELRDATNNQASTVEELASSIGLMAENIDNTAVKSTQMLTKAKSVEENAQQSVDTVLKTVEAIEHITSEISFVSEFSRMTNLLSINAAIEAARVGEYGRTFSEVAKQVKSLAEKSQKAAVNITELSDSGLSLSQNANDKIIELKEYINQTVSAISEIQEYSQEQAAQSNEINGAIQSISNHIQATSNLAEKLDDAIKSLSIDDTEH
ncbi:methyl-accepting chemotaxis protein [Carboxylicivirga sp. M1479]|uniref:methyl-accepting chemotaxis protein n=1 Tax=Carboxylicivirga sp. M1479 TaxID=2594476 RepID=UPI001178CDF9|nr:methyl-accepting chemotaxis protein [Carboxylicivirga sp. M1479]TRX66580.1 hypothetical protein FNN09_13020 [Carboxylicivirga sp. M1479]